MTNFQLIEHRTFCIQSIVIVRILVGAAERTTSRIWRWSDFSCL